jgi:hypothetical protein
LICNVGCRAASTELWICYRVGTYPDNRDPPLAETVIAPWQDHSPTGRLRLATATDKSRVAQRRSSSVDEIHSASGSVRSLLASGSGILEELLAVLC